MEVGSSNGTFAAGAYVPGAFNAVDPEGASLTYTMLDTNSPFYVEGNRLRLSQQIFSMEDQWHWVHIRATDPGGLYDDATYRVKLDFTGVAPPVVLDLDRDGVELISLAASSTLFDMDSDGDLDRAGWVAPDDGMLALDRNSNGTIDDGSEIGFLQDVPGAVSDLEGLAAYDSNEDGILSNADDRFADFKIWRDENQDGVSQAEELVSLAEAGLVSISLAMTVTGISSGFDNFTYATGTYVAEDGYVGLVEDVFLAYSSAPSPAEAMAV